MYGRQGIVVERADGVSPMPPIASIALHLLGSFYLHAGYPGSAICCVRGKDSVAHRLVCANLLPQIIFLDSRAQRLLPNRQGTGFQVQSTSYFASKPRPCSSLC